MAIGLSSGELMTVLNNCFDKRTDEMSSVMQQIQNKRSLLKIYGEIS